MGGAANGCIIKRNGEIASAVGYNHHHINFLHAAIYWANKGDWDKAESISESMLAEVAAASKGGFYDHPNAGIAPVWYGLVLIDFQNKLFVSATNWDNPTQVFCPPDTSPETFLDGYKQRLIVETDLFQKDETDPYTYQLTSSPIRPTIVDTDYRHQLFGTLSQVYQLSEDEISLWEEWVNTDEN